MSQARAFWGQPFRSGKIIALENTYYFGFVLPKLLIRS
jgi:hypothetical protein